MLRGDRDKARPALGERPGLVDDERGDLFHHFERLGVPKQNSRLRAATGSDHDRHRRRKAKGARARDDQHRDGIHQRVHETRFGARKRPDQESEHRNQDDDRHEPRRNRVCQTLNRRPRSLSLAHHSDDLGQQRVRSDSQSLHDERPRSVDRATSQPAVRDLLDGNRLASHHRLVHAARALANDAVHGNALSWPDSQSIADLDVLQRDVALDSIRVGTASCLWRKSEERAYRRARPAASAQLQHLPEQDEHGNHRRRLEVDRNCALHAKRMRQSVGKERRHHAERVGGADAERDEREHVEMPAHNRRPPADEKRPAAPKDDRRRQTELDPIESAPVDLVRQQIEDHERKNRQCQDKRPPKPPRHVRELFVGSILERDAHRFECHPTDRTRARALLPDFRVHRARVVGLEVRRGDRFWRRRWRSYELLRVRFELFQAAFTAEVISLTAILDGPDCVFGTDRHPADGIQHFGWSCGHALPHEVETPQSDHGSIGRRPTCGRSAGPGDEQVVGARMDDYRMRSGLIPTQTLRRSKTTTRHLGQRNSTDAIDRLIPDDGRATLRSQRQVRMSGIGHPGGRNARARRKCLSVA